MMTPALSPFSILLNVRRIQDSKYDMSQNWVIACEMFNVSERTANLICQLAGIDPDSVVVEKIQGS